MKALQLHVKEIDAFLSDRVPLDDASDGGQAWRDSSVEVMRGLDVLIAPDSEQVVVEPAAVAAHQRG